MAPQTTDDGLCEHCVHVFSIAWRRFSFLGNASHSTRRGWPRFCHFTPCLVYAGTPQQLTPAHCRMCGHLENSLNEHTRRGPFGHPGVGATRDGRVTHSQASLVDRLLHRVVGLRLYKKPDAFRVRLEFNTSTEEVKEVQVIYGGKASLWFKVFADHGAVSFNYPPMPFRG